MPRAKPLSPTEAGLTCLVCERTFRHLGSHLWLAHAMTGEEYREEYELGKAAKLTNEAIRTTIRAATNEQHRRLAERRQARG